MKTSRKEAFYAMLLRLYPRAFRNSYGPRMRLMFRRMLDRDYRHRGRLGKARFWFAIVLDAITRSTAERARAAGHRRSGSSGLAGAAAATWQDLRYAARSLRKQPSLTASALLILTLGIGATTSIFTLINSVVLEPLPYEDPESLVRCNVSFSLEMLDSFRESTASLQLSAYTSGDLTLISDGIPEIVPGGVVSGNHFEVLGVQPFLGRSFRMEEEGDANVAVVSYQLWQRRFGGDEAILGSEVQFRGQGSSTRTIVGVMPADFRPLMGRRQVWVPHSYPTDSTEYVDMFSHRVIGRLPEAAGAAQAGEELRSAAARFREKHPTWFDPEFVSRMKLTRLHEAVTGNARQPLWVLLAAAGLLLLIACANVANLLLARATGRRNEVSIRSALGAGRRRLLRQFLTESALLGLSGGLLGIMTAWLSLPLLQAALRNTLPRSGSIEMETDVVLFAAGVSLVSILFFGLAPALKLASGWDGGGSLHGHRFTEGVAGKRLNEGLVVVQIAISAVLAVGAGLMLKSFWLLLQVNPGFPTERLLSMRLSPPASRYQSDEHRQTYFAAVLERVRAVPGVERASFVNLPPLDPSNLGMAYQAEGHESRPGPGNRYVGFRSVYSEYFATVGIPILKGRPVNERDRAQGAQVCLINASMSERLWPGQDPLGKEIRFDAENPWCRIVGIAGDIQQQRLDSPPGDLIYRPYLQEGWVREMDLVVRTESSDPLRLVAGLKQAVWSSDREVPISAIATVDSAIGRSVARRRLITVSLSGAGILALTLGVVGVYGVTSYSVGRRSYEFGVRKALGADRGRIVRMTLAVAARPVALGAILGALGSAGFANLLGSFLFQVDWGDASVLAAVTLVLGMAALIATFVPARRAARVDPVIALRGE